MLGKEKHQLLGVGDDVRVAVAKAGVADPPGETLGKGLGKVELEVRGGVVVVDTDYDSCDREAGNLGRSGCATGLYPGNRLDAVLRWDIPEDGLNPMETRAAL